jgi:hypothetical protein
LGRVELAGMAMFVAPSVSGGKGPWVRLPSGARREYATYR